MRHASRVVTRRKPVFVAAALVAVLVVGSYGGWRLWQRFHVPQVDLSNTVQHDERVNGQDAMVLTSTRAWAGPRPLALVTHGYRADERILRMPYMAEFTQDLLDAGWIVAASEAHGDAWGSDESQDDHVALHQHVTERYDVSKTVIASASMGAVSGLNMVAERSIPNLAGWVGVSPVTDLEAMAEGPTWGPKIHEALDASEVTDLSPRNLDLPRIPMFVYGAETDKTTPVPVQATPFARETGAKFIACTGGHVAPDCFRAEDVIKLGR